MTRRATTLRVLNASALEPFEYGTLDCALLVARIVQEITGVNYAEGLTYSSEPEAMKILEDAGGFTGLVSRILGKTPVRSGFDYGDPILVGYGSAWEGLGAWFGHCVMVKLETGIILPIDLAHVIHGWRI